jgi:hypothetical protein
MKKGIYRQWFPKQEWKVEECDVAWYILMGPENYKLDLFTGWSNKFKKKILYIYDTLPIQYETVKRILKNDYWDILITSFNDAQADLEKLTDRKWYCVEQAADLNLFKALPYEEKSIHFSSYGRRFSKLHEVLIEFCDTNNIYYDYTTHDTKHPTAVPEELYKQYAWHLNKSLFTFSWPVELTNPERAGHLSPITCRWFEAAAAGTILIGQQPRNKIFEQYFKNNLIAEIDFNKDKLSLFKQLDFYFYNSKSLHTNALDYVYEFGEKISWTERVRRINTVLYV